MKDLFNFRLYLEGLKKIRLIGIAASIVTVGLCALMPIIYITNDPERDVVYNLEINEFAIPLVVIMAFVPFFVKSVFSYLDGRRESDFYHAIPYKRHTVYTSFLLAALTWTLGIIIAAVLVSALLWSVAPYVSFAASTVPLLIASAFTACLMLAAFMAVAMALTGTATSNIFIFGLIACFFRAAFLMITYALDNVVYILDISETVLRFTDIWFFFPLALLGGALGLVEPGEVYGNVPMYIYTAVLSVALLVLAGRLYVRRRSEMAGKSAPSRRLQHVYRIAFTTPFVLLMFTFVAEEIFGHGGMGVTFYIVMSFVVLVVYFLYELITTKSPKSMLRSAPYLVILLLIGVVFTAGIGAAKSFVLSVTPEVDEMESVTVRESGYSIYAAELDYETLQTKNVEIRDKNVLKYVSDALKFSVESVENGTYTTRRYLAEGEGGYKSDYQYYSFTTVSIKLKNGRTIGRRIKLTAEDKLGMLTAAKNTDEYASAYLRIPEPEQIYHIWCNNVPTEKMKEVYAVFYDEYTNDLSRSEQIAYKGKSTTNSGYNLECSGREGLSSYTFDLKIDASLPKTLNALAAAMAEAEVGAFTAEGRETDLNNREAVRYVLETIVENRGNMSDLMEYYSYSSISVGASLWSDDDVFYGTLNCFSWEKAGNGERDPVDGIEFLVSAMADGRLRTTYGRGDYIIKIDTHYYVEGPINTADDGKDYLSVRESVYGSLLLFCDAETAAEFELYLNEKVELYGDTAVKEIVWYD